MSPAAAFREPLQGSVDGPVAQLIASEEHPCWHGPIYGLNYGQAKYNDHMPGRSAAYPLRIAIVKTWDGYSLHHFGRPLNGQKAKGFALSGFCRTEEMARELLPAFVRLLVDLWASSGRS